MANFDATIGPDAFTASAGADDTFTFATGTANAGDTFDGNDGTDTIVIAAGAAVDFRAVAAGFTAIEALSFAGGGTTAFASSQLDGSTGALPTALQLNGDSPDAAADIVQIFMAANGSLDISAWDIGGTWNSAHDQVQIFDTAAGDENITGTAADDVATVTGGNDIVDLQGGGMASDRLVVDYHNSVLAISRSSNVVTDGGDNSVTFSGVRNLTILTGSGSDELFGGPGLDVIKTGAGNDTVRSTANDHDDIFDGGADVDTIDYTSASDPVTVNLNAINRSGLLGGLLTFAGYAASHAAGYAQGNTIGTDALIGFENIIGGSASNSLTGNKGANDIIGGDGDDVIVGGGGDDDLDGGIGNDLFQITNPGEFKAIRSIDGGHDQDGLMLIHAGKYNFAQGPEIINVESILLHQNKSYNLRFSTDMALGDGDGTEVTVDADTLIKHKVVITASGTDLPLIVNATNLRGNDKFTGTDYVKGDSVKYDGLATKVTVDLVAGTAKGAGIGHDKLISIEHVYTGGGNDVVVTGAGPVNNHVDTGNGNDRVTVAGGADEAFMGGGDDDLLIVKYGAATIAIVQSGDHIGTGAFKVDYNSVERFNITTGSGNDNLAGEGGDDVLKTGAGTDTLFGGGRRDTMTGGADADTFVYADIRDSGTTAATRDLITDFAVGLDKIDLSGIDADFDDGNGDTGFSFEAGEGDPFSGSAGDLRWFQVDAPGKAHDKTIIEGDIDGDSVADFQIELKGLISLAVTDLSL